MTTTIGPNTLINAHIEGTGELVVEGRIEGSVVLDDTLMILDGGFVAGDVDVDTIIVEGAFDGTIRASRLVHLRASANVAAEIYAQNVRIDPGARFKGRVEMDVTAAQPVQAEPVAQTRDVPRVATTERPRYESRARPTRPYTNGDSRVASTSSSRRVETRSAATEPRRSEPARVEAAAPQPREPEPVVSRAPKASQPARQRTTTVVIEDPDEMTVKELRDMLKEHDLPVSGTKQELVERLRDLG